MFGFVDERVRLPPELLLMIARHLTDTDCLAISLSGLFEGFTSLYNRKRNPNNITIDYKYFFLSDPRVWKTFFHQNAPSPSSITSFNATNCYWIPAERLCYAVVKMPNLEELSIKETKVSLPQLARVFELCQKITKLDFTYREKNWEEIQDSLMKQNHSSESIIQGFKKLTCLKISTSFLDARDYLNDPWLVIIRMLSWCRECVELTVEITYSGEDHELKEGGEGYEWNEVPLSPAEEEIKRKVKEDFFPHLDWMMSLKKLVLMKLGEFTTRPEFYFIVRSLLLEDLFHWLASEGKKLDALQCIWIKDFRCSDVFKLLPDPAAMTSYYVKDEGYTSDESFSEFSNIEHLGGVNVCCPQGKNLLPSKLKYVLGCQTSVTEENPQESMELQKTLGDFFRNNQEIEYLNVEFMESDYVPSVDFKLPKLKALVFEQDLINKDVIDVFKKLYPNIESLQLHNKSSRQGILKERESLSAIHFPNLTSLHLYGEFQLHDGAFLKPLIKQCPKLESLHLTGILEPNSFLKNFDLFLPLASRLRDLRLTWGRGGGGFPLLLMLTSLLGASYHLERLVLHSGCKLTFNLNGAETGDRLIEFASKMKRLVCCCLVLYDLDEKLIKKVHHRIAEEVVPKRPSLWFHLGREEPLASDPDVPKIHFHEMFDPTYYVPVPNF